MHKASVLSQQAESNANGFESIEHRIHELLETVPCLKTNHFQLVYTQYEKICLKMPISEDIKNKDDKIFGGAIYGLADVTAGMAATLDGRNYVTQNSSFSFFTNVSEGEIFAVGEIIHRQSRVAIVTVNVFSQEKELLAHGTFHMFAASVAKTNL